MAEDVMEHIRNKKIPPHGRVCLMEFVITSMTPSDDGSCSADKFANDCLKPLAESMISCCEDSDPKVRDAAGNGLVALAKVVKSRGRAANDTNKVLAMLESTAPRVYKKMQSSVDDSTPSVGKLVEAPAPAPSTVASAPSRPQTASKVGGGTKVGGPNLSSSSTTSVPSALPKKAAPKTSAAGGTSSSGGGKKPGSGGGKNDAEDDNVDDLTLSPEDAENILATLDIPSWESSVKAGMVSSKWQDKVEALNAIGNRIAEAQVGGQFSDALVIYLHSKTAGFRISNINIMKAVIQTACSAAQNPGDVKFSKAAAWELIKNFGDKFSDKKTKEVVDSLLTALAETTSPGFVIKRMKVVMDKTKAPLAHQHFLEWLKVTIADFGASSLPIQFVGSFCQLELENKMATVRTAAVEVMGALYNQLGPRLQAIAISDDMKPALKSLLEAEFAKVGYDPAAAAKASKSNGEEAAGGAIPRQDLMSLVDKNILSELNNVDGKNSWQNRKGALEALVAACERSGHYLEGNKPTIEIIRALKPRMNDTQANLKPIAASAIGHFVASLELDVAVKVLRMMAGPLLGGLADNKKTMKDATIAALQVAVTLNRATAPDNSSGGIVETSLLGALLSPIGEAITATVVGRQELLQWLYQQASVDAIKSEHSNACLDLTSPLVTAMQDKTASVRTLAELMLSHLMVKGLITKASLDKATRDLPVASKRTIQPSIDRMMASWGSQRSNATNETHETSAVIEEEVPQTVAVSTNSSTTASKPRSSSNPRLANNKTGSVISRPSSAQTRAGTSALSTAESMDNQDFAASLGSDGEWLLRKTNKTKRLEEFSKVNWPQPPEEPGESEFSSLRVAWEPIMDAELAMLIFDQNKNNLFNQDNIINPLTILSTQIEGPSSMWLPHSDVMIRYLSYCLCLRETAGGLVKILGFLNDLFVKMQAEEYMLHDAELNCLLPQLVDKCGHKSERHKLLFKQVIAAMSEIVLPNKMNSYLLQGLTSKNRKSRVVSLEEILRMVEKFGANSLGRGGIREVSNCLDSKESDQSTRSACLEIIYVIYTSIGSDINKLYKLTGDISEKSSSMIEDRIRQKGREGPAVVSTRTITSSIPSAVIPKTSSSKPEKPREEVPQPKSVVITSATLRGRGMSKDRINVDENEPIQADIVGGIQSYHSSSNDNHIQVTNDVVVSLGQKLDNPIPVREYRHDQFENNAIKHARTLNSSMDEISYTQTGLSASFLQNSTGSPDVNLLEETVIQGDTLNGIYADIAEKIDALLEYDIEAEARLKMGSFARSETDVLEEAKDYIKMFHAIVTGEWSQESNQEDDVLLYESVEPILERIIRCLPKAFENKANLENKKESRGHGMDVSMIAVIVATIFAVTKRQDLLSLLNPILLREIFKELFTRLIDERLILADETEKGKSKGNETIQQVSKALNTVLLKLASNASKEIVLPCLIELLGLCASESSFPKACAKPLSRLLRRIVTGNNTKTSESLNLLGHIDNVTKNIAHAIHEFLTACPKAIQTNSNVNNSNLSPEDVAYVSVKFIISEIAKAMGGSGLIQLLQEANIPPSAALYTLCYRITKLSPPSESEDIQHQLQEIIQQIVSSRDKTLGEYYDASRLLLSSSFH
jgi:hypothetical protein